MFKSEVIPMIESNMQINAIKLAICYQYRTEGAHVKSATPATSALWISIYGIDKTGDGSSTLDTLLAICPLLTTSAYGAYEYAASVIVAIPPKDYPAIYYTYDNSAALDFVKIVGQPMLFAEAREYPDQLDASIFTSST